MDILPILRSAFNPLVDFGLGFGIGSLVAVFARGGCLGGSCAISRRCPRFCRVHNDLIYWLMVCLIAHAKAQAKYFKGLKNLRVH